MTDNNKFEALAKLGAGEFQHLNGDLMTHLKNTANLLEAWGAREALQDAGLYHAAYGTAGFDAAMVGLNMRQQIANVIGEGAEQQVYLYCSCDRDFVFSGIKAECIPFRDRFTLEEFVLSTSQANDFCELTVANEMELVLASEEFRHKHGEGLKNLFEKMTPWLTQKAIESFREAL